MATFIGGAADLRDERAGTCLTREDEWEIVMTDLEKVLANAQYTALALPREKSSPTTIYSFHEGQLFIVRDPHTCLSDPPLKVTQEGAVDTLQFQREFTFNLKGIVSFFVKIFSLGKAQAELEAKKISSATVEMGGLQHETIQTGELIDFLMKSQPSSCLRDVLDKTHFTVIAALKAASFTYTFKNSKGATISLTLPEAEELFKTDTSVSVSVTTDGKVIVNAPRYVGVISWKSTYGAPSDWVFPSKKSKERTPRSASVLTSDYLRSAAIAAGVDLKKAQRFGFHNLRHSLATFLVNRRTDVKTVQKLLWHANVTTTLGRYAKTVNASMLAAQEPMLQAMKSDSKAVN